MPNLAAYFVCHVHLLSDNGNFVINQVEMKSFVIVEWLDGIACVETAPSGPLKRIGGKNLLPWFLCVPLLGLVLLFVVALLYWEFLWSVTDTNEMIIATIEQLLCGLYEPAPHFTATQRSRIVFSKISLLLLLLLSMSDELNGKYRFTANC